MDRVQKLIANSGMMSRRKAEELIDKGKVSVNGKRIKLGDKASPDDRILVDGKPLNRVRKTYLAFHKPAACLTTLSDPKKRKTIFDYIRTKERVVPVGRLDYWTEGLLLLTNDGEFANKIAHPRYEVKKVYHVYLDKPLSADVMKKLEEGVDLEDGRTRPTSVRYLDETRKGVSIRIHEGKNRIVRRMFYHFGYKTKRLVRVQIGRVKLDIPVGKTRPLKKDEIQYFLKESKS